jgi:uncharacterized membrane protein
MNDPDEPQSVSRTNAIAAGAVALAVCAVLIGLFVWQPWSPVAPAPHTIGADAK